MFIFGILVSMMLIFSQPAIADDQDVKLAGETLQRIEEMKKWPLPMGANAREQFEQTLQNYEAQIAAGMTRGNIQEAIYRANELHRLFSKVPQPGDSERIRKILDASPIPLQEPVQDRLGERPAQEPATDNQGSADIERPPVEPSDLREVIGDEVHNVEQVLPGNEVNPGQGETPSQDSHGQDSHGSSGAGSSGGGSSCSH